MYHGYTSFGDPNAPTYFHAQSVVGASQGIVTGFPSWKGFADPGTKFGAAFANELGNRMHFSLRITGDDQQISISQLMLTMASSDPDDALGFSYAAGAYNYSNDYQGVLKGSDGMLGTGDDVFITSGPNTQLVDAIVGRGSGNSFAAYCTGCTVAQQQQAINDAAAYWSPNGGTFTGTYTLGAATGSGTFTITAVPEPATWALMIGGFGLIGAAARRRRTAVLA
ncbi:hypothetical protein SCH01S_09_00270 [Sphingomonas changbaiensis NBRC 104936]|uniref:Ice-binding protein C-terminal domain-containing protein n=1 Tax=Sphingomonas changbaiensis NBRC 104936 TaxID=1219043 RepID=A0A0E9MM15_9SPHN|nr:PEPxxWA-CTERM sorting domain-containing protein [Sphingomonas changbaiensis]GAO38180.1 hypothetical protein SCH01S_09_00270 [Sphingomonas changbaiensis NBRC 104936]